jgi:hypothetical protein
MRKPRRSQAPLVATFRIEIRRKHTDTAPVETIHLRARTAATARHAARAAHPEHVVLSVHRDTEEGSPRAIAPRAPQDSWALLLASGDGLRARGA